MTLLIIVIVLAVCLAVAVIFLGIAVLGTKATAEGTAVYHMAIAYAVACMDDDSMNRFFANVDDGLDMYWDSTNRKGAKRLAQHYRGWVAGAAWAITAKAKGIDADER